MAKEQTDLAILIALPEEMALFVDQIDGELRPEQYDTTGDIYYQANLRSHGTNYSAIVALIGNMGPTQSAIQAGRLLEKYQPSILLSLGIAGGFGPDVSLGDVVIATSVDHFIENAKANDNRGPATFQLAGEVFRCSRPLVIAARNLRFRQPKNYLEWETKVGELLTSELIGSGTPPKVHDGPIASGPIVVASANLKADLLRRNRRYLAVEMESAGILAAADAAADRSETLVIRGIADFADFDKTSLERISKGQNRAIAMRSATLYLLTLLPELLGHHTATSDQDRRSPFSSPESAFIGRDDELAELKAEIGPSGPARLLNITGEGGIGKTRLAAEFVKQLPSRAFDNVVWVDLGSTFAVNDVVGEISRAAGIEGSAVADKTDLVAILKSRSDLLILDNFESVTDRIPLVAELLHGCPRLKILVTSRERLHLLGEACIQLAPLPHELESVTSAAVGLFVARATPPQQRGIWTQNELIDISGICSILDGIPLAIEIVASHTEQFSVHDISRMLRDPVTAPHFLSSRQRSLGVNARITLGATFESSCRLLDPSELKVLEDASYFSGGATLNSLAAVSNDDGRSSDVSDGIRVLMDRSLIRADTSGTATRYYLLAPLRQYVLGKLESSSRGNVVRNAHSRYFLARAAEMRTILYGPEQHLYLDEAEADVRNYVSAHDWAVQCGEELAAMELLAGLGRVWFVRNQVRTGEMLAEQLSLVTPQNVLDPFIDWLITRALLIWLRGRSAEAEELLAAASAHATDQNRPELLANAYANRGLVAQVDGDLDRSREYYGYAAEVAEANSDAWNLAICKAGLGAVSHAESQLETALDLYLQGIELFRATGDTWSLGRILRRIAAAGVDLGDQQLVLATTSEASALADLLKDAHAPAELDRILARNAAKQGFSLEAIRRHLASGILYMRLGRYRSAATGIVDSAKLLLSSGYVHAAGRASGVAQQLLGTSGMPGPAVDEIRPTGARDRVAFSVGFEAGYRGSPRAELEALMERSQSEDQLRFASPDLPRLR